MIPRRNHNASSGSLPAPPDDKHASNDHIREYLASRLLTYLLRETDWHK